MKARWTVLLVCLALVVAGLAMVPPAQAAAGEPTVIVGTVNDTYAPFNIPIAGASKSRGFDHDLVVAIAKVAGFDPVFRTFDWAYLGSFPGPWADCEMVAAGVTPFPARRSFMTFSELYFVEDPYGPQALCFPKTKAGLIYRKWFGVAPTTIP